MSARVFVWEVSDGDPSGLPPGKYCVWAWGEGQAELMFKPLGERTFRPAAQGQEERT